MLVNFIYKWVCFIGFIAAMKIVKRMLGNDNFDSVSSSPLTCWYLTFATIDVQNIQFHKKDTLSPKMRAQILHQSVPMKRKKKKNQNLIIKNSNVLAIVGVLLLLLLFSPLPPWF